MSVNIIRMRIRISLNNGSGLALEIRMTGSDLTVAPRAQAFVERAWLVPGELTLNWYAPVQVYPAKADG